MGTTLTAVVLDGDTGHFVHVGDSRAYLLRDGELEQLSDDHSLVGEMVRDGRLSAEEAVTHPHRSILSRALGTEPLARIDEFEVDLRAGDVLLLCSDGLSGAVPAEAIGKALGRADPDEAAARLIAEARKHGGPDNITAVVLRFDEPLAADEEVTRRPRRRGGDGGARRRHATPAEAPVEAAEAAPEHGRSPPASRFSARRPRRRSRGSRRLPRRPRRGPRAARAGRLRRRPHGQHRLLRGRRRRPAHRLQRPAGHARPAAAATPSTGAARSPTTSLGPAERRLVDEQGLHTQGRRHGSRRGPGDVAVSRRNIELLFLVIAGAVSTMAYVSVYAGRFREINRVSIIYGLIFVAIFFLLHLLVRFVLPQADPFLLPITALLAADRAHRDLPHPPGAGAHPGAVAAGRRRPLRPHRARRARPHEARPLPLPHGRHRPGACWW